MNHAFAIAIAFLAGGLIALVLTSAAWEVQIEGRAYECNDSIAPVATFHTNMSKHRDAGDRLMADWTWERIEEVGKVYRIVFFALWFVAGSAISIVLRKRRRSLTRR